MTGAAVGRLILVRHGESKGNRDRIFAIEPSELPLTLLGYEQARAIAREIAASFKVEAVVASPFLRARETARVIAEVVGVSVAIEPDLYEREVGELRGQSYDSIYQAPGFDTRRPWLWRPTGGESYEDVRARAGPVLDRLVHAYASADVVIVSHGGVMQTLWAHATGDWQSIHAPPNCGVVLIEHAAGRYRAPLIFGSSCAAIEAGG